MHLQLPKIGCADGLHNYIQESVQFGKLILTMQKSYNMNIPTTYRYDMIENSQQDWIRSNKFLSKLSEGE